MTEYNDGNHQDPEVPAPVSPAQEEVGRILFDIPESEFRVALSGAIDDALNDHRELFLRNHGGKPLSPEEAVRFHELNEFILIAGKIVSKYQSPETEE